MTTHPSVALVNLPQELRSKYDNYSKRVMEEIRNEMRTALEDELYDAGSGRSFTDLWVRLDSHISNKYPMTRDDRTEITKLLLRYLSDTHANDRVDLAMQARVCHSLVRLIKKQSHFDLATDVLDLTIDWKLLFKIVETSREGSFEKFPKSRQTRQLDQLLFLLIQQSRPYFAESATAEILDRFLVDIAPIDDEFFFNLAMLCAFLPTNYPEQVKTWVPRLMNMANLLPRDLSVQYLCANLYARVAKHCIGVIDWDPIVTNVMQGFLQSLSLRVGKSANPANYYVSFPVSLAVFTALPAKYQDIKGSFASTVAKLLVYTMNDHSKSMALLKQFLTSVKTFYHPTNSGTWSKPLGTLLTVARQYAYRVGDEKRHIERKTLPYDAKYCLNVSDPTFVDTYVEVALVAMFAPNTTMTFCATTGLHDLAYLFPQKVLPPVLKEMYPALETKTQSFRMMAAMKVIQLLWKPILDRELFPEGAEHFQGLLMALLPGIEITSPLKTLLTLTAYQSVFCIVPFIDARDSKETGEIATSSGKPHGDEAREASMFFGDWSELFLEAMMKFMSNQTKNVEAKNGHKAASFTVDVVNSTLQYFFHNMSSAIYDQCVTQICKYITSNVWPDAIKEFGAMIKQLCGANAERGLPIVVKTILSKLCKEDGTVLSGLSNTKTVWYVYLLGQACRQAGTNDSLLPYAATIQSVYAQLKDNEDKDVKEMSRKMLRGYLQGLTSTYPTDFRSFSQDTWGPGKKFLHYEAWGRGAMMERIGKGEGKGLEENKYDLNIQWHVPSEKALATATALLDDVVGDTLTTIKAKMTAETEVKGDTQGEDNDKTLVEAMEALVSIVRGANSILGNIRSDLSKQEQAKDAFRMSDELFPECHFDGKTKIGTLFAGSLADGVTCLRPVLVDFMLDFAAFLKKRTKETVQLYKLLNSLGVHILATEGCVRRNKMANAQQKDKILRQAHRRADLGLKCQERPYLITQQHLLLQRKLLSRTFQFEHTKKLAAVVDVVAELCCSDFLSVRERAMALMLGLVARGGKPAHEAVITKMLAVVATPEASEEKLRGAIGSLSHPQLLSQQTTPQSNRMPLATLCALMTGMCLHGQQHDHDKAQEYMNQLALKLVATLNAYPVDHDDDIKLILETLETLADFLAPTKIASVNWRYQLMTVTCIDSLINFLFSCPGAHAAIKRLGKPSIISDNVMTVLTHGTINMLKPYNSHCQLAVARLLAKSRSNRGLAREDNAVKSVVSGADNINTLIAKIFKPAEDSAMSVENGVPAAVLNLPFASFASAADFDAAEFLDSPSSGWSGARITVTKSTSEWKVKEDSNGIAVMSDIAMKQLHDFINENITTLIQRFVDSMRVTSTTEKGFAAEISKFVRVHRGFQFGMPWPIAFEGRSGQSDIAHYVSLFIHELSVQFPSLNNNFSNIMNSLLSSSPSAAAASHGGADPGDSKADANDNVSAKEDDDDQRRKAKVRVAAALFTGMVRGSYYKSFAEQQKLSTLLSPVLIKALDTCQSDTVNLWVNALQGCLFGVDARRVMWLVRLVVTETLQVTLGADAHSRSQHASFSPTRWEKYLTFMRSVLFACGYQGIALVDAILGLDGIDSWLSSPFTVIRASVTRILRDMMMNVTRIMDHNSTTAMDTTSDNQPAPNLAKILAQCSDRVKNSPLVLMEGKTRVAADELADDAKDEARHFLDTVLGLLIRHVYYPLDVFRGFFFDTLDSLLAIEPGTHTEFSNRVKTFHLCASWYSYPSDGDIKAVIQAVKKVSLLKDWHVRQKACVFLSVFIARHALVLSPEDLRATYKMMARLVGDIQVEVRLTASTSLISLLMTTRFLQDEESRGKMIRRFQKLAQVSLPKRKREEDSEDGNDFQKEYTEALAKRHGGVIGLSALCQCFPYTIPDYLPVVLAFLAVRAFDPSPIKEHLQTFFSEFKRTHQDKWDSDFTKLFTEDQLAKIADVEVAPSYFG